MPLLRLRLSANASRVSCLQSIRACINVMTAIPSYRCHAADNPASSSDPHMTVLLKTTACHLHENHHGNRISEKAHCRLTAITLLPSGNIRQTPGNQHDMSGTSWHLPRVQNEKPARNVKIISCLALFLFPINFVRCRMQRLQYVLISLLTIRHA